MSDVVTVKLIDALIGHALSIESRAQTLLAARERQTSEASRKVLDRVLASVSATLDALKQSRDQARQRPQLLDDRLAVERLHRRLRRIGQTIWAMHVLTGFVVHSGREQVPEALTLCLEALSARWFPAGDKVAIVQSEWDLNFYYQSITRLLAALSPKALTPCDEIGVLSFPTAERDNLLLNCLVFHEFGHQVDRARKVSGRVMPCLLGEKWRAALQTGSDPIEMLTMAQQWLEELCSDMIACAAIGPAYFFAFTEFGMVTAGLDDATKTHPSARIRLSNMLDFMDSVGYCADGPFSTRLTAWRDYLASTPTPPSADGEVAAVAESLAGDVADALCQSTADVSRPFVYDAHPRWDDIAGMSSQLARLLTPSAVHGSPSDVQSVLNAAWLCYLDRAGEVGDLIRADPDDADERAAIKRKINELAMTTIEHAFILQSWELATHECAEQQGDRAADTGGLSP